VAARGEVAMQAGQTPPDTARVPSNARAIRYQKVYTSLGPF